MSTIRAVTRMGVRELMPQKQRVLRLHEEFRITVKNLAIRFQSNPVTISRVLIAARREKRCRP